MNGLTTLSLSRIPGLVQLPHRYIPPQSKDADATSAIAGRREITWSRFLRLLMVSLAAWGT
jgi:hypothetical protein